MIIHKDDTMSKNVKQQLAFIKLLAGSAPTAQRKLLLETITKDQLLALSEIALNLLSGVLVLSPSNKKKLSKHKNFIRLLSDKKISRTSKKKAIQNKGALISLMLKAILPSLQNLLE